VPTELKDTENAHQEAMSELEKMKDTMEKMELERAAMVAEVEAQIERALASMAVGIDDSEDGESESRPHSRLSSVSGRTRSRRPSDARPLRSFGTESTLAESYGESKDDTLVVSTIERETGTIAEDEEGEDAVVPSPKKKRFSASEVDIPQDGMNAVDEGITQKSDKIAQKVLQIQHKVGSVHFCCISQLCSLLTECVMAARESIGCR
jgi:nicotinamide N-methyltransferase